MLIWWSYVCFKLCWYDDLMLCWYDDHIFVLSYVDMMILCLIEFKLCWCDDPMLCWYDDPIFVLSYVDMMILCLIQFKLCWYDGPMLCWYDDPMFFFKKMLIWWSYVCFSYHASGKMVKCLQDKIVQCSFHEWSYGLLPVVVRHSHDKTFLFHWEVGASPGCRLHQWPRPARSSSASLDHHEVKAISQDFESSWFGENQSVLLF